MSVPAQPPVGRRRQPLPNRLIGDGKLPPGERMTRSNISKYDAPDAEKYMRVSGLLGPVRVKFFERVKITPQDKN